MEIKEFSLDADLELALKVVRGVAEETVKHFLRADFTVSTKPDRSLVSEVDRNTEQQIRYQLLAERPEDTIYGEEYGIAEGMVIAKSTPNRRWIIDPIDATNNYIRGMPVWATLLALEIDHEVVIGVVNAPMLNRCWYAAKGQGAFLQIGSAEPRRLEVSRVDSLENAFCSYSSLSGWRCRGCESEFTDFLGSCWRSRAFGDFWSHLLVAEGVVDISAEPELELYDMAALYPIIKEAGGVFTDLRGNEGPWGGNALVGNPKLHAQALARLGNLF